MVAFSFVHPMSNLAKEARAIQPDRPLARGACVA